MKKRLKVKKLNFAGHQTLEFADYQEFLAVWDPQRETLLCENEIIQSKENLEQKIQNTEEIGELFLIPAVCGG